MFCAIVLPPPPPHLTLGLTGEQDVGLKRKKGEREKILEIPSAYGITLHAVMIFSHAVYLIDYYYASKQINHHYCTAEKR